MEFVFQKKVLGMEFLLKFGILNEVFIAELLLSQHDFFEKKMLQLYEDLKKI